MTKPIITGFFAYSSSPPSIGETIKTAIDRINGIGHVLLKSWEDCKVGGKVLIQELCREIRDSDIFCAELSKMNANVMFELGYAIAKNKRTWLTLDPSFSEFKTQFEQLRVLTTLGYAKCSNSAQVTYHFNTDAPFNDLKNTIFEQAIFPNLSPTTGKKLLYLKSRHDIEASVRLTREVQAMATGEVSVIMDDPQESSVQTLTWYGTQVYSSSAVICHLTSPDRTGAMLHNARHALVAGLAFGMGKPLLMLTEGEFLSPVDYRDILVHYSTASEAIRRFGQWQSAFEITLSQAKASDSDFLASVTMATELKELQVGEYVAENEAAELVHQYFVETAAYQDALEGRHLLFVGRKGAGKTANLLKLASELGRNRRNLVCLIKPVAYELHGIVDLLGRFRERDAKGFAIESLWKFLLYTEIANVVSADAEKSTGWFDVEDVRELNELLDSHGGRMRGEFALRLERSVGDLLLAKPRDSTIEQTRTAISEAVHESMIGRLRVVLGRVLKSKSRVAILIDNLDKTWDKQSDIPVLSEFLLGLLTASSRIVIDFKHSDSRRDSVNVSLAVFLRSDIFENVLLAAREPDKIAYYRLNWKDPELLLRVIEERFVASHEGSVYADELWHRYFCKEVGGIPVKQYITTHILPRPRDLVFLVKAAIGVAVNRGHPMVTELDLSEGQKQYSQYALESILVENGITIRELENVLYEFVGSTPRPTQQEVRGCISRAGIADNKAEHVIEHLCVLSFLGIEVAPDEFRFVEERQDFKKSVALAKKSFGDVAISPRFMIHSAFRAFLECR